MTPPSEVAGRYVLDRRLGAGGMSTVFLATDEVLERYVAVKLLAEHLAEDEAFVARFRREALAAASLQHPNVVQVFDSGEDDASHRHYIVMEYVEGPSCADLLREHKQLDVDETVRIIRDACHGLDYAHRAGVVHRDVKPGNLLVASETGTTKLADFGIAKAAEQTRITQVGSVLGTAAYLSPEQARGDEAGPASDIYSLGRLRVPVPGRQAPPRVLVAHRAGAEAAGGVGRADRGPQAGGPGGARPGDQAVPPARAGRPLPVRPRPGAGPRGRRARRCHRGHPRPCARSRGLSGAGRADRGHARHAHARHARGAPARTSRASSDPARRGAGTAPRPGGPAPPRGWARS